MLYVGTEGDIWAWGKSSISWLPCPPPPTPTWSVTQPLRSYKFHRQNETKATLPYGKVDAWHKGNLDTVDVGASIPRRQYILGPSSGGGGRVESPLKETSFFFSWLNLAWGLFVSKTSLTSLLTHVFPVPICLSQMSSHLFFSKSKHHSGVPSTTRNWNTNSAFTEHCAQQVSWLLQMQTGVFKRWKDSWRILWYFGECLWADHTLWQVLSKLWHFNHAFYKQLTFHI